MFLRWHKRYASTFPRSDAEAGKQRSRKVSGASRQNAARKFRCRVSKHEKTRGQARPVKLAPARSRASTDAAAIPKTVLRFSARFPAAISHPQFSAHTPGV